MLQLIIMLCLRIIRKLVQPLLYAAGLIVSLSELFTKQCARAVYITALITCALCFNSSMSDIHALSEIPAMENVVKSERLEQIENTNMYELENILDMDDSEAIPSIKEMLEQIERERQGMAPGFDSPEVITAIGEKAEEKGNESTPLFAKKEEPSASVSAKRHVPDKKLIYNFNLGVHHQKQGNNIRAIYAYKEALKLDPDNAEVHNNLGVIYKEQGDLDKAVEHFQHVVSFNPGMDEAYNNLGVIHFLRGNQREAVLEYQKALELNPDNQMSRINLGLIFKAQGLKKKAIDTLEEVLLENSFHPEAHYNLAILYEELGHLERAIWHYTRFIDNAGKGYLALTRNVARHIKDLEVISGVVLGE